MTEKLYLKDPYKKNLKTKVIKHDSSTGGLILDKTIFYPEGGGQPADRGTINGIEVTDVQLVDDRIHHFLKQEIPVDTTVNCQLDWNYRRLLMQQHTGQHILSRVLEVEFDADTVGFHISDDYVTIDIDQQLTNDNLTLVENKSNEIIYNNLSIKDYIIDKENIEQLPIRNEPKVKSNIRIVEIDNFDYCPCGGTHLNYTSEVGMIKIKKTSNYKEGMRIEFVCGKMALKDYQWKNESINNISNLLSIKAIDVEDRVNNLFEDNLSMAKEIKTLTQEINALEVKSLIHSKQPLEDYYYISKVFKGADFGKLRNIAANLTQNNNKLLVIFLNDKEKSSNLLIGKSDDLTIDIRNLFNTAIKELNGNGGGNDYLQQGGGQKADKPEKFIENIINSIN